MSSRLGGSARLGDFRADRRLLLLSLLTGPVGVMGAVAAKCLLWLIAVLTNAASFHRLWASSVEPGWWGCSHGTARRRSAGAAFPRRNWFAYNGVLQSISVLGLGIIGLPWAARYHAAGKLAGTWNRTTKPHAPQGKPSPLDATTTSVR